jgi:uncharacterized membrane protein YeaQ/YmgE (transglycosylase-associated protein family)
VEFAISLGLGGWILVVAGALVLGIGAQLIGHPASAYQWLLDGIAAGIGAIIASEFIVAMREVGPVWDGLAFVPALIGALTVIAIVEVASRYTTRGTYSGRPMSA